MEEVFKFSEEEECLHHLIIHANDIPRALGLFNGKAGIMLVLAHYARARKKKIIEKVSDFLMSSILENLDDTTSIGFGDGLAGIGWSIEYLIRYGYLKGIGIDICESIDKKIMEFDIRRSNDFGIEHGLEGLFYYWLSRQKVG